MSGPLRILALSQDRGSYQAILPAMLELTRTPSLALRCVAPPVCLPLLQAAGFDPTLFDESAFAQNPRAAIAALFDEHKPHLVLSGSSTAKGRRLATPEQYAILEARQRGAKSLGVLDYWGLFDQRLFSGPAVAVPDLVPDCLCALDQTCHDELVAMGVPASQIAITHNPWMDNIALHADCPPPPSPLLTGTGLHLLYVSQPVRNIPLPAGAPPIQQTMLHSLTEALPPPPAGTKHRIIVWKHPAEASGIWDQLARTSSSQVEIHISDERGGQILAHLDALATINSTVAYEALYYGTPCLSLRFAGAEAYPPLYIDTLSLAHTISSPAELKGFFATADLKLLRTALLQRKKELTRHGLFFSDGHAAARVAHQALALLRGLP